MKIKLLILLLALTVLVILQNGQLVRIQFLFWSIEMKVMIALLLTMLVGFLLGYGFRYWWQFRKRHDQVKRMWSS